jgi:putative endonuclease
MMHYVYLLKDRFGKLYIGYTSNLKKRLQEHARGKSKYLSLRRPVKLIYYEAYLSEIDARERERKLKKFKNIYSGLKSRLKNSLRSAK